MRKHAIFHEYEMRSKQKKILEACISCMQQTHLLSKDCVSKFHAWNTQNQLQMHPSYKPTKCSDTEEKKFLKWGGHLMFTRGIPKPQILYSGPVFTIDMKSNYGRWSFQWSKFIYDFLKKQILIQFTRCKLYLVREEWPCTKKWMCWFFFNMPKMVVLKKFKFDHFLLFFWASLLVQCVEDVACKSSHYIFYKNERFNVYIFNVIYMRLVPCVVTPRKLCT